MNRAAPIPPPIQWGHATYHNMTIGTRLHWAGHDLCLIRVTHLGATLAVDGQNHHLPLCRRALPTLIDDIRLFCADTRPAASLTTDTFTRSRRIHGCLQQDALLCISPAATPLLAPSHYAFPIPRDTGFTWTMDESSHMFAYMGPTRAHEGIDLDLSQLRSTSGTCNVVAMEDAAVVRLQHSRNGCVMLQSQANPAIHYTYQHIDGTELHLQLGQTLQAGEPVARAVGDTHWPHLHLAICHSPSHTPPSLNHRFNRLLNGFAQLYELYWGDLIPRTRSHPPRLDWSFGPSAYWLTGNQQRSGSYTPLLGYGWELGPWCRPDRVEQVADSPPPTTPDAPAPDGVRLRTVMFPGTPAESHAPSARFTFRIDLPPGAYALEATCGDPYLPSSQTLSVNDLPLGTCALAPGETATLQAPCVQVPDGILRLCITPTDHTCPATLQHLLLHPLPIPASTPPSTPANLTP